MYIRVNTGECMTFISTGMLREASLTPKKIISAYGNKAILNMRVQ